MYIHTRTSFFVDASTTVQSATSQMEETKMTRMTLRTVTTTMRRRPKDLDPSRP